MIHELKIYPEYFEAIVSGKKTFEVRKLDRDYKVGDLLALNEFDMKTGRYTGNSCIVSIDYILNNDHYCKTGYVVLSIKPRTVVKRLDLYRVPYATKKEDRDDEK